MIAKRPLTLIYRAYLRTRFRLSELDIHLKNPLIYPFVSKSVGGFVLLIIGVGIFIANVDFANTDPDILLPHNLLVSYVSANTDVNYTEVVDSGSSSTAGTDFDTGALSAQTLPGGGSAAQEPTDAGDIAYNSDSLIKPTLPTESAGNITNSGIRTYVVQSGDTLSEIAEKFGLDPSTIAWANDLTTKSNLRAGQSLTILPVDGVLYRVKAGDGLSRVANNYQSDVVAIVEQNHLAGADDIRIGELLILPEGVPPAPIPQATGVAVSRPTDFVTKVKKTVTTNKPKPAPSITAAGPGMIWPTTAHIITQYFSWQHTGVDIAGPITNTIFAAADGTVIEAETSGYHGGYGNVIVIDHGNGVKTRYGHTSQVFVKPGQRVTKGQAIAMVGSTGRSTGPHLHFEVILNGTRVNPLSYVHR